MKKELFRQIGEFRHLSEAFIYKGKLESEGIEIFIWNHHALNADPLLGKTMGGIKLFVRKEDYENSLRILSEINPVSKSNPRRLVYCFHCDSSEIVKIHSITGYQSLFSYLSSFLFRSRSPKSQFKYKCTSCGYEFD